jgi:hypothetical protein
MKSSSSHEQIYQSILYFKATFKFDDDVFVHLPATSGGSVGVSVLHDVDFYTRMEELSMHSNVIDVSV